MGLFSHFIIEVMLFHVVFMDNYLVYVPPEPGSHTVVVTSAAAAMINRNHNVTLLVADIFVNFVTKQMLNRTYTTEIYSTPASITPGTFQEHLQTLTKHALEGNHLEVLRLIAQGGKSLQPTCESTFSDHKLMQRLKDSNFDLVFAHSIFTCSIVIAQYLDVRYVTVFMAIPPSIYLRQHGNPVNPAYSPEIFTGFSDRMSFLQRVINTGLSFGLWLLGDIPVHASQASTVKRKYNIKPELSMVDSLARTEIWFIGGHFVLDFPRAFQPNVIQMGGISARSPGPLSGDLEDFMQSSGDAGVIIFSMGSYINSMDTDKANMIADAFAKIPQKVLWKLAGQPPSKIPPNVKISKWLPQNDLLGHPKTRAMVYHCGLNGVFEAIHHAVPVICIPVLGDQWDNAKRLEVKGVGMQLDWFSMTSETIVKAVETIIGDKSYQANMTRLSAIFHDEPLPAAQRVVYWMEKVVRHGGAGHLRTSALELNSIQHNLIDVIAFIATILVTVLTIVIYIGLKCCRCCLKCCKGSGKQKAE